MKPKQTTRAKQIEGRHRFGSCCIHALTIANYAHNSGAAWDRFVERDRELSAAARARRIAINPPE